MGWGVMGLTVLLVLVGIVIALIFLGWRYYKRILRERFEAELMGIAQKVTERPSVEETAKARQLLIESKTRKLEEARKKPEEKTLARELLDDAKSKVTAKKKDGEGEGEE